MEERITHNGIEYIFQNIVPQFDKIKNKKPKKLHRLIVSDHDKIKTQND